MEILQNIISLPKIEKLLIMEYLWQDLFEENNTLDSPDWHKKALAETEKRVMEGKEEIINWTDAKRSLRKSFE
ncbi:acyl-protein synthetase [Candidatus Magnetomorum sp. HK-1]|nr:acyl-protein synthetase [Candidatus Magnetomorum sp. HK-1]